jgi:hypothetical protein
MAAAGEIAAAVYNTNRSDRSDPVLSAADFVPKPLAEISSPENDPEPELDIEALKGFWGGVNQQSTKARFVKE